MTNENPSAPTAATTNATATAVTSIVTTESSSARRDFMRQGLHLASGAALMGLLPPGIRNGAWAAGSDAPEKKEVRIGFIPLTDCSSVVMAAVNKFDAEITG